MNKETKNMVEVKDADGNIVRVLMYADEDGVRVYRDRDTGDIVKTLTIYNGGVSEEQVKTWKGEHRKVHMIEVEDDGDLFIGYFHRPSMETMSAVNKLAKADEVKSTTTMFENCWLGGDPVMKIDTLVRMAAIKQLGALFNSVVGTLKNL